MWIYWPDVAFHCLGQFLLLSHVYVLEGVCTFNRDKRDPLHKSIRLFKQAQKIQHHRFHFPIFSSVTYMTSKTGLMMWDHSYSRQHSGTMGPVQAGHSPPSLCSQPKFSNMSDVPSPPQHTSCSKLGGLLSKFKPHFDRIRNWRCNKGSALRLLLWHTEGMSVWEWAAMETSWQRLSPFAGQV